MDIGLAFFSSDCNRRDPFELFIKASVIADQLGLSSIWIPERHFHKFGGAFPCPAVAAGALASCTHRIDIRAGSIVSPLHDSIEIAEQWGMVHALSHGRVGISFASGWKEQDFVMQPQSYPKRREKMWEQVKEVQALWRGQSVNRSGPDGVLTSVCIYPKISLPLPNIWITTTGAPDTIRRAGKAGLGLFTHLVSQSLSELEKTISIYRKALPNGVSGHVALMIHTFMADTDEQARAKVQDPLKSYLRQFIDLTSEPTSKVDKSEIDKRLEFGVSRYLRSHSLIGSYQTCRSMLEKLETIGVDEVACLTDFGLDDQSVLQSVERLGVLCDREGSIAKSDGFCDHKFMI